MKIISQGYPKYQVDMVSLVKKRQNPFKLCLLIKGSHKNIDLGVLLTQSNTPSNRVI